MAWNQGDAEQLAGYLDGLALIVRAALDVAKAGDVKLAVSLVETVKAEIGRGDGSAAPRR